MTSCRPNNFDPVEQSRWVCGSLRKDGPPFAEMKRVEPNSPYSASKAASDHPAIRRVLEAGRLGETYNVGSWNEKPNLEILHTVCALLYRPSTFCSAQPAKANALAGVRMFSA